MQNTRDISNITTAFDMALALMAKAFTLNNTTPTNNNQRNSSNSCNSQIAQSGNLVGQNAVQNQGIQNVRNQNGLSVISRIANQNPNRNGNVVSASAKGNVKPRKRDAAYLQTQLQIAQKDKAGIQLNSEEFDFMAAAGAYDEIEKVIANCNLQDILQQASTSGTQADKALVYDSDGSTKKALELEIERLLRASVSQDILSIVQNNSVVDTSNLQTKLEQCKYDKISYDKAYNDMQQKIKRLQAQLGDLKGKSKDTSCASEPLNPLPQKLENENVKLKFQVRNYEKENAHLKTAYKNLFDFINMTQTQTKTIIDSLQTKLHDTIYENAKLRAQLFDKVSEQKDTTKGTSVNTLFCKQSILGKPPSFGSKLYSVTPFLKSSVLPKVDKTNALSKPVTVNLAPSTRESKGVQIVNVIALRIFRTNPFKTSRVDNVFPNKPIKASIRTKSITVSQPHVITKNNVNSKTNGSLIKMLKALLGLKDRSLGTILRVIRSLLSVRVAASRIRIVPTEMELVLEQTQQGTSHEVSISTKWVEESKRIVRTKGVKKEALYTTLGRNQTGHAEDDTVDYALMAFNSSNSGSDTENLKKKKELKTKLENFQSSSKGLSKLLNSQMNAKEKSRLGIYHCWSNKISIQRKRRGVIIQDSEETTTTATVQPKVQAKDKGKAILIEEPKPLKRQAQIELDEEVARQLEAELNADINWNAMIEQVKGMKD
nr:hypothetical protein [Tanacetum cinerariifolium]